MSENNITKNSTVGKKFTNGGSSKREMASSWRYHGWSSMGLKRYNELFDIIEIDRKSSDTKTFEESFREFCINGGLSGKKRKRIEPVFEEVKVCHGLWSVKKVDPLSSDSYQIDCEDNRESCIEEETNISPKRKLLEENKSVEADDSDDDEDPFGLNKKGTSV